MDLAKIIYLACALISFCCAAQLVRVYIRQPIRLLLWSSLCFGCLAINNMLLFVDLVMIGPNISLLPYRSMASFIAVCFMVYGLILDRN